MNRISAFVLLLLFLILSSESNAQKPTTASSNLSFSNVYCNQLQLNWISGNGTHRLVLARKGAAINSFPIDDSSYFADNTFTKGEMIGNGNFVVYTGTADQLTIYGLESNAKYYFAVFEYNENGANKYYLTTGYPELSITTESITADFSIDNDYQCLGGNLFIFANHSSNSLNKAMTYVWDFGDGKSDTAKSPTHTYSKGDIFKVKLKTISTGCEAAKFRNDTVVAPANAAFILATLPENDSVQCLDGNRYFFYNQTIVGSIPEQLFETSYRWYFDDGTNAQGYDMQKKFSKSGIYEIKLVTSKGIYYGRTPYCSDSISKYVEVLPSPGAEFTTNGQGLAYSFTSKNSDITNAHKWYFGDGDSSSLMSPVHEYKKDSSTYLVCHYATNVLGCTSRECFKLNINVGIKENEKNTFSVYPNPTTGTVNLQFKNPISDAGMSVYNLVGEKIFSLEEISELNISLDLSKLSSGIYFIQLNRRDGIASRKILLTK